MTTSLSFDAPLDTPCDQCGEPTKGRVRVENDGHAAVCSIECELRFEGEQRAVAAITNWLEWKAGDVGSSAYAFALTRAVVEIRDRKWRVCPTRRETVRPEAAE